MRFGKVLFFSGIVFFITIVNSCSSAPGNFVLDPSLSPNETTLVEFGNTVFVNEYNGIYVHDTWYPNGRGRGNVATLPAGPAVVNFNYGTTLSFGNIIYNPNGQNVQFNYVFETGKEYFVGMYMEYLGGRNLFSPGNHEYGLAIWDRTSASDRKKENAIKTWYLGEIRG